MANPVFTSSDTFKDRGPSYEQPQGYAGPQGYGQPGPQGYAQPGPQAYGQPAPQGHAPEQGYDRYMQGTPQPGGVMTLDDVIVKSAITLLAVFAAAALSWIFMPPMTAMVAMIASSLLAFVTVLIVAGRRTVPVAGVMIYALLEGVFIGTFSRFFEDLYPGIVVQAVLATFVVAGVTLAAFKFFNIEVSSKFRQMVIIGTWAFAIVMLINLALVLFGVETGLRSGGWLAILVSVIALVLAVFNLVLDFDYIKQGVRNRAPASESWRAALGLTVTMVWLYTELLRLLSYLRD